MNDRLRVTCDKMKEDSEFPPIEVELREIQLPDGRTSCVIRRANMAGKLDRPYLPRHAQKLLDFMKESGICTAVKAAMSGDLEAQSGLGRTMYQEAMKALKSRGLVESEKRGRCRAYWLKRNEEDMPAIGPE